MTAFRILTVGLFACLVIYTGIVAANHGLGLFGVFFGDLAAFNWPGQFNLDFLCYLLLGALWIGWRHGFSPKGSALAIIGIFGGGIFLFGYLFWATFAARGDVRTLLLGKHA